MSLPTNKNILRDMPGEVFVETGMWRGDGIAAAKDAAFNEIHSLDNDKSCIEFCYLRFDLANNQYSGINLHWKDSALHLEDVIRDIDKRICFLLDAHWQFLEGTEPGQNPFPLLKELRQISKHKRNDHIIIIDDWHIFYEDRVGYGKKDILRELYDINSNYKISYIANPVIDGMLIAKV